MKITAVACFAFACLSSLALADDFKTIEGKEYKNVTVRRVEPDGIVLATSFGISKVYFTELPKEVQERFHYDAAKGAAVSSQEAASITEYNKRVTSQKQESPKNQQDTCQALLVRYTQLGHEKDDLYIRSGHQGIFTADDKKHLGEVLHEINQLTQELGKHNCVIPLRRNAPEVER